MQYGNSSMQYGNSSMQYGNVSMQYSHSSMQYGNASMQTTMPVYQLCVLLSQIAINEITAKFNCMKINLCRGFLLNRHRLAWHFLQFKCYYLYDRACKILLQWFIPVNYLYCTSVVTVWHVMGDYKNFHHITAHRCTYPGCRKVLILDGNLKNQHDVCSATEAGYIKYTNLPGAIMQDWLSDITLCYLQVLLPSCTKNL